MANARAVFATMWLACGLAAWTCAHGAQVATADSDQDLHGLGWLPSDVYDTSEGLPDPTVNAIASLRNGQVWVGTMRGLARQSGTRMVAEHGPGGVLDRQILSLVVTADDALLVSVDGGGIWKLRNGRWSSLGSPFDEQRTQRLRTIPTDTGERVFAVGGGVAELVDGQWRRMPLAKSVTGREVFDVALEPARDGQPQRLWVGTFGAGLQQCDGMACSPASIPGPGPRTDEVRALALQPRKGTSAALWVAFQGGGLARRQDGEWTRWHAANSPLPSDFVADVALVPVPSGGADAWIGTRGGLAVLRQDGTWTEADPRVPQLGSRVRTLATGQDAQGKETLWSGSDAGAVRTPLHGPWRLVSTLGFRGNGIWNLLVEPLPDGTERLWMGSDGDGLQRFEHGQWHAYGAAEGLPERTIRSILRVPDGSPEGALWVGPWSGRVLRLVGGRFVEVPTPWEKRNNEAVSLLLADGGGVWASTRNQGIAYWNGRTWAWFGNQQGMPSRAYSALRIGKEIWMTTADRGLGRLRGTTWEFFGKDIGLPPDALYDARMIRDASGTPVLWIGSNTSGILRVDIGNPDQPRLVTQPALPTLPVPMAYGAVQDGQGALVVCTDYGVVRLKRVGASFQDTVYHRADGLPHDECNANAMQVDDRGRVWIGTVGGAAVFTPPAPATRKPAPFLLGGILVDGTPVPVPANGQPLVLPARSSNVEVMFDLLTGEDEQANTYRLIADGNDAAALWRSETMHRLANLSGGQHVFRIEARDATGASATPITLAVDVPNAWWETTAARLGLLLAIVVVFWSVVKWRERQLRIGTQRLAGMVQQRTSELKGREGELRILNDELLRLSYLDPLTGLANRRRLFDALDEAWQTALATATPLSVLMLDLDHFKAFNDRLGHQAGDERLQRVAQALASRLPQGALAARYGGEEFCILLPGLDADAAAGVAELLRAAVGALMPDGASAIEQNDGQAATTASIGLATLVPTHGMRLDDLVARADSALYAAKKDGRNCVRIAPAR